MPQSIVRVLVAGFGSLVICPAWGATWPDRVRDGGGATRSSDAGQAPAHRIRRRDRTSKRRSYIVAGKPPVPVAWLHFYMDRHTAAGYRRNAAECDLGFLPLAPLSKRLVSLGIPVDYRRAVQAMRLGVSPSLTKTWMYAMARKYPARNASAERVKRAMHDAASCGRSTRTSRPDFRQRRSRASSSRPFVIFTATVAMPTPCRGPWSRMFEVPTLCRDRARSIRNQKITFARVCDEHSGKRLSLRAAVSMSALRPAALRRSTLILVSAREGQRFRETRIRPSGSPTNGCTLERRYLGEATVNGRRLPSLAGTLVLIERGDHP